MSQPNPNGGISTTTNTSPSVQLIPPPPPPPPPPPLITSPNRNTAPSHPLEYAQTNAYTNTNANATTSAVPTIAPMTKATGIASTSTSTTSTSHQTQQSQALTQTQMKRQTQRPSKPDSAEVEVDKFLSAPPPPSNNEDNPPKLPQLKPKPLTYAKHKNKNKNQQMHMNKGDTTDVNATTTTTTVHANTSHANNNTFLLLELVSRRAWSDVIKLSDELLFTSTSIYQPLCSQLMNGHNDNDVNNNDNNNDNINEETLKHLIQIIQWRIRSMYHLRKYNDLILCIEKMNLTCSNYCNKELPSWVPLSLILQSMECMAFAGKQNKGNDTIGSNGSASTSASNGSKTLEGERKEKGDDAILDEFYTIRKNIVKEQTTNNSDNDNGNETWNQLLQLDIILSNILTQNQEWRLTLVTLEHIIGYSDQVSSYWARKLCIRSSGGGSVLQKYTTQVITRAILVEIYSRQGRVLLQTGALPAAATVFERAHDEHQQLESSGMMEKVAGKSPGGSDILSGQKIVQNMSTQILLNEGLLHFAHMDYDLAEVKFNKAIQIQRKEKERKGNMDESQSQYYELQNNSPFVDSMIETEGDLLVPCLNNFALCALYTCRMHEAIALMEILIREDPTRYLTHCIVFNLCTLYELGWDTATSERKKRVLQLVAKRFSLHDVGIESFRLN